jgi:hypothetical protein
MGKKNFAVSISVGCALAVGNAAAYSVDSEHDCFDGSEIELVRYSSACERASESLASVVRHGIVFSAEELRTLESPCAEGPAPGIDVLFDMESHSILLDFSRVTQGGRFPETGFDGYIFDVLLEESNGLLLVLAIDRELSTLKLDDRHVEWDHSHIEVNLEGAQYDQQSLLKLDLVFARVPPL